MQTVTPGRWRGLKATSTEEGVFTILAIDHRGSLRAMLPDGASYDDIVRLKSDVVGALAPYLSAVLLDPNYSLRPAMQLIGRTGLLMPLEQDGYLGEPTRRRIGFDADWDVGKIRRAGASAVKLLAYYHPESGGLAEAVEATIGEVADTCHRFDLPVFVEPLSYSLEADAPKRSARFAAQRPEIVRETARRLSALGADVLKLEFPVDVAFDADERAWRAACEAVSAASAVPWVLLSAGVDFETYARQVRVACRAGASGFLAGRAIWKEITALDPEGRRRFLADTAIPRLQHLAEIAARSARPWTEFYAPPAGGPDWYRGYTGF